MKKNLLKSALFSLISILAIGVSAQPQQVASLQGTITDRGAVVPNVDVSATNTETNQTRTTRSNGAGYFMLSNLPLGHYKVTAKAEGFATKTKEVDVTVGASATVNFDIFAPEQHGQITVRVIDATNHPVAGAHVTIQKADGESHSGVTDQQGRWTCLSLGGGKYVVSAADVNALPKNVILADNGEQAAELKKR